MANNPNPSKSQQESQGNSGSQGQRAGNQGSQGQQGNQGQQGSMMKDAASYVTDKAKTAASSAASVAGDAASYVGHKAEDATSAVAGGIKSLGSSIRDYGPQRDFMGSATETVAETVESAGRYLEEHGLSGIAEDVTAVVRRNPIPALFIAAGIGFLLARATSSRS